MKMYKLSYFIGKNLIESYHFPSLQLARWKEKQLRSQGSHNLGTFKIEMV